MEEQNESYSKHNSIQFQFREVENDAASQVKNQFHESKFATIRSIP